jgi:hypothetical protein
VTARVSAERLDRELEDAERGPRDGVRLRFAWMRHEGFKNPGWCSLCRREIVAGVVVATDLDGGGPIDRNKQAHHFVCAACVACMATALPAEGEA